MKKIVFSLVLLASSLFLNAQTAKPDTNYKRPYYEQRVSLFNLLPKVKGATVFIGNSITDGNEWMELLNCKKCLNRGISGDISLGVLARIDDVLKDKPKKLFIMIGINDISRGIPNDAIIANYKAMLARAKSLSPKTAIYLQSILPINSTFRKFTDNSEESIKTVNKALQEMAQNTQGVTYIDLYSKFLDADGRLDKKYTNDGLHLLGEGYILWTKILKEGGFLK